MTGFNMASVKEVGDAFGITKEIFTVTDFHQKVGRVLTADASFAEVHLLGEVSDLSKHDSGHYYFSLTDGKTSISCALFKHSRRTSFELEEGMEVLVIGDVGLHPKRSIFQIRAFQVFPIGAGIEAIKLKQLKEKLERAGLFDPARKKTLPEKPEYVGLILARNSKSELDILQVFKQTAPEIKILINHVDMVGGNATKDITEAIKDLQKKKIDAIIIARGGGMKDDLKVFNDEAVVRAISSSKVPIITGIGHGSDITLADFAADKSAITPTAAAKEFIGDAYTIAKAEKQRADATYLLAKTEKEQIKKSLYKIGRVILALILVILVFYAIKLLLR